VYKKATEVWVDLREKLLIADVENPRLVWRLYWATHQVLSLSWCLETISSCLFNIYDLLSFWIVRFSCKIVALLSTLVYVG
jgi:hypothetical protein